MECLTSLQVDEVAKVAKQALWDFDSISKYR